LGFASGTLDTAVATYQQDQFTTTRTQQTLSVEQRSTLATLTSLASARQAVQTALNSEEATLNSVDANMLTLINAANEARQRARAAEAEEALAAQAAQQASSAPASVTVTPTVFGRYSNPLRGIRGIASNRVDQGADFGGYGPIYAIGDGVVLSVVNGGWPGGTFICYRLENGPANGLVVYVAEDINPEVQIGQQVTRSTVLGQLYDGPVGMETGWAAPAADGVTMAASYGQFWGSNTTAFGANFSQFLNSLGAPGGQIQNSPTGSLPSGWPTW
jgi:murein DD-endopeptidase MepM/ murein hydrolase activator NlpD